MKTFPMGPPRADVDKFASKWQRADKTWWTKGPSGPVQTEAPKARGAARSATPPAGGDGKPAMPTGAPPKTPKVTPEQALKGFRDVLARGEVSEQNVKDAAAALSTLGIADVRKLAAGMGHAVKDKTKAGLGMKLAEAALKAAGVKATPEAVTPVPPPSGEDVARRRADDEAATPPPAAAKAEVSPLPPADAEAMSALLSRPDTHPLPDLYDAAPESVRAQFGPLMLRLWDEGAVQLSRDFHGSHFDGAVRAKMVTEGEDTFTSMAVTDPAKVREVLKGLASGGGETAPAPTPASPRTLDDVRRDLRAAEDALLDAAPGAGRDVLARIDSLKAEGRAIKGAKAAPAKPSGQAVSTAPPATVDPAHASALPKDAMRGKPIDSATARHGIHDAWQEQKLFKEHRDGLVSIPRLWHEAKGRMPDLTVGQFHAELEAMSKDRDLEMHKLNEVQKATPEDRALSITRGGPEDQRVYHYAMFDRPPSVPKPLSGERVVPGASPTPKPATPPKPAAPPGPSGEKTHPTPAHAGAAKLKALRPEQLAAAGLTPEEVDAIHAAIHAPPKAPSGPPARPRAAKAPATTKGPPRPKKSRPEGGGGFYGGGHMFDPQEV